MLSKTKRLNEILGDARGKAGKYSETQFKPKWQNLPTIAIRIPEVFAQRLKDLARKWDVQEVTVNSSDNDELKEKIRALIQKIDAKEKGYKQNSATTLIKEIKSLANLP